MRKYSFSASMSSLVSAAYRCEYDSIMSRENCKNELTIRKLDSNLFCSSKNQQVEKKLRTQYQLQCRKVNELKAALEQCDPPQIHHVKNNPKLRDLPKKRKKQIKGFDCPQRRSFLVDEVEQLNSGQIGGRFLKKNLKIRSISPCFVKKGKGLSSTINVFQNRSQLINKQPSRSNQLLIEGQNPKWRCFESFPAKKIGKKSRTNPRVEFRSF